MPIVGMPIVGMPRRTDWELDAGDASHVSHLSVCHQAHASDARISKGGKHKQVTAADI